MTSSNTLVLLMSCLQSRKIPHHLRQISVESFSEKVKNFRNLGEMVRYIYRQKTSLHELAACAVTSQCRRTTKSRGTIAVHQLLPTDVAVYSCFSERNHLLREALERA